MNCDIFEVCSTQLDSVSVLVVLPKPKIGLVAPASCLLAVSPSRFERTSLPRPQPPSKSESANLLWLVEGTAVPDIPQVWSHPLLNHLHLGYFSDRGILHHDTRTGGQVLKKPHSSATCTWCQSPGSRHPPSHSSTLCDHHWSQCNVDPRTSPPSICPQRCPRCRRVTTGVPCCLLQDQRSSGLEDSYDPQEWN